MHKRRTTSLHSVQHRLCETPITVRSEGSVPYEEAGCLHTATEASSAIVCGFTGMSVVVYVSVSVCL